MLTEEDKLWIEAQFVSCERCEKNHAEVEKKSDNLETMITKMEIAFARLDTKMNWLVGLLGIIGTSLIGLCVNILFK